MSDTYEIWHDKHTLFVGDVTAEDTSFSHELGFEKREQTQLESFSIIVYIQDVDYDVTSAIEQNDPKSFEDFKEWFITKVDEQQ